MYPHQAGSTMERLWADEVRRLHSLWHRGPPRDGAPKGPNPKPSAAAGLGPMSSTLFKRAERRRKRKEERMQRRVAKKLAEQLSLCPEEGPLVSDRAEEASRSEIEWPCEPSPVSLPDTGWGVSSQKPVASSVRAMPASQEEQGKLAALRVHQKALRAWQGFLSLQGSSDDEVEDEEEEEDDQMDEDGEGDRDWGGDGCGGGGGREGFGYLNFFLGLFEEDGDLRAYYEKNWEKGEFCCLVCEGIGVKVGKRFVDCVALVQHSSSITKTKRREAHRAFGRAICRVLGWDITRLPSIVLDMGETLGQTLAKATGLQKDGTDEQSDEILVDVPQAGGVDHDNHSNYLEADDNTDRLMEVPSSEVKWTCEPSSVSLPEARWGDLDQKPLPSVQALPSAQEEQGRLDTMQVHQKALRASQDFFSQEDSSDVEDEDEDEDGPMDEEGVGDKRGDGCGGGEGQEGSRYFNFFLGFFEDNGDLRSYYEKNWEKGEFCCLVCGGIGVKVGKSFKDCVALVQHSNSVTKSEKREAHRAFGRAICRVLGWDITRLPSIVDMEGTMGQRLAKATGLQDGILKQSDEILVDVPQPGGTDHDNHSNYLEVDDNPERLMAGSRS